MATAPTAPAIPRGCQTGSHYAIHVAPPCQPYGDGQCDGFCEDHNDECSCSCHSEFTNDLPDTIEGVRIWHDVAHGLLPDDEVAKRVFLLWEKGNGWIPGAAFAELAEALGADVDLLLRTRQTRD